MMLFDAMGSLNNYVDKIRGVGGPKISIFVHVQGTNVHVVVAWSLLATLLWVLISTGAYS